MLTAADHRTCRGGGWDACVLNLFPGLLWGPQSALSSHRHKAIFQISTSLAEGIQAAMSRTAQLHLPDLSWDISLGICTGQKLETRFATLDTSITLVPDGALSEASWERNGRRTGVRGLKKELKAPQM